MSDVRIRRDGEWGQLEATVILIEVRRARFTGEASLRVHGPDGELLLDAKQLPYTARTAIDALFSDAFEKTRAAAVAFAARPPDCISCARVPANAAELPSPHCTTCREEAARAQAQVKARGDGS